MSILSFRIDNDFETRLEYILKKRKITDKSAYLRNLLDKSVQQDTLDYLAQAVKEKHMSAWKAAEIANISLRQMMHELGIREVYTYDDAAFQQDLAFVNSLK
jgi:predicted HTH domain antitoxin